ncbi:putative Ig domain-containing protein [Candidatus Methanoperedens nitroreducens]|uniref:Putative Ig domain-containing protein n=1 Tax=Candidatus Methanoperedens nitratireducens TaxID=1392998 RepID=A0A062V9M4_9EURY|nr:PGF-pre-PGF domain-containing protein [Candidatus Methanoperedens nitroreducens]KCZ72055.1 putative Ig domain-containing protein [Candidatus Methanoperedens nitroreducens]MDJ1421970.1 PGF-pre-PGF domain-containing protein [Candidatus Methanoperedens sp.]
MRNKKKILIILLISSISLFSSGARADAPVLEPIGNKTVNEGELLEFTINATGENLTYSAGNLPAGASFDPDTHVFTWTSDFTQAGTYRVNFTVSDPGDLVDSEDITITVNNVNRAPSSPARIAPVNWQNLSDGNIRLTWKNSTDADGDNLTYDWQLSNQAGFPNILRSGNTADLFSDLSLSPGTYYWRVRANDSLALSNWSNRSKTPDFQIVSAPNIDNVKAFIITNSTIKVEWTTDQSYSSNRVLYGYHPDLEDGNWSSWNNNTDNPAIVIDGLTGQSIYYQVFSFNASNSSAYSNSSISNIFYPLELDIRFIEPTMIDDAGTWVETWVDARVGHTGKFIGYSSTFKNMGADSLVLTVTEIYNNRSHYDQSFKVTLSKNESKFCQDNVTGCRLAFYIEPDGVNYIQSKEGFFNLTLKIDVTGKSGSWAFNYTNITTISLPVLPIFRIKQASGGAAVVIEGRTTSIIYTLEANSTVNLTNVSIYDPIYSLVSGRESYFIEKLEANKPQSISYTYPVTIHDLSKFKCEETERGYPCIINIANFSGTTESGDMIYDTDYVKICANKCYEGTVPSNEGSGSSARGGSSSGGIPPSEDFNNMERREVREMDILARSLSAYVFRSADPVMVVSFESSMSENEVQVAVEVLKNRSKNIGVDAPGKLYKYFNIFAGMGGFSRKISNGVVVYRINNTWLEENDLDPKDIGLYKWEGKWVKKNTEIVESKQDHTYYASLVGNFSSFAIAGVKKQEVASGSPQNISMPSDESANNTSQMSVDLNLSSVEPPGNALKLPAAFILIIGIIVAIIYLKMNHNKSNENGGRK